MIHIKMKYEITTLRQNGRRISQMIFQMYFCEWQIYILIKISLKFAHKGAIEIERALF